MLEWKKVIADAKELLDLGAITPEEFELAKKEAIELRTKMTNPDALLNRPDTTIMPGNLSNMGTVVGDAGMLGGVHTMGTYVEQAQITKVGNYILSGEIGKGGMGTVYRARHSLDSFANKVGDVVIKLMHPEFAQNAEFVERFIGEAALGRTLSHPNLVKIHDIVSDADNQTLAIVMDLVEGRPLEDIIPDSGMSFEEALPIIEQLCSALDYIHEQGVLHRDLKPENIIIQPDGTPVILDMGIAKDTSDSDLSQTSTGMAMGTPLYMAPEQLDAKNATSAVDRFAFGLIIYQMLSGELPWEDGLGQGEILAKKFSGNLKPLEHQSKEVSNAVMGLLRANATDRTESCAAFLLELKQQPTNLEGEAVSKSSDSGVLLETSNVGQSVGLSKQSTTSTVHNVQDEVSSSIDVSKSSQSVSETKSVSIVQDVQSRDIAGDKSPDMTPQDNRVSSSHGGKASEQQSVPFMISGVITVGLLIVIAMMATSSDDETLPVQLEVEVVEEEEVDFASTLQMLRSSDEYEITWDPSESVWVVCLSAVQSKTKAQSAVDKHRRNGVDAHLLWIPDFASTSGAEYYLVYVGPFEYEGSDRTNIKRRLKEVKNSVYHKAYAIRLDQNSKEERIK